MREAMFWSAETDGYVRCTLCPHHCRIAPGARGVCHVRENRDGVLYSLNYGRIVASNIDPIEKKPLYHYLPGSQSFSVAGAGCNMHCSHCQNASISQVDEDVPGEEVTSQKIVAAAQRSGCRSLAYTYTEPTIYYETMLETATLARNAGLDNIMISNGYMEAVPFEQLAPLLQGANIDLKAFDDKVYRNICGARLQPVLDSLKRMYAAGIWLEVTTLIIPGYNDDKELYDNYGLNSLIEYNNNIKISIDKNPLVLFLSILDTIEPTKAFSSLKAKKVWEKIMINYYNDNKTIQINILDRDLKFDDYKDKIKDLESWTKVKVISNKNSRIIKIKIL